MRTISRTPTYCSWVDTKELSKVSAWPELLGLTQCTKWGVQSWSLLLISDREFYTQRKTETQREGMTAVRLCLKYIMIFSASRLSYWLCLRLFGCSINHSVSFITLWQGLLQNDVMGFGVESIWLLVIRMTFQLKAPTKEWYRMSTQTHCHSYSPENNHNHLDTDNSDRYLSHA